MSNEPTIKRSPHDKKNPYTMVSKELIKDNSISHHARGVLIVLLSLPDDWVFYHSNLQKQLAIGEKSLNSALQELLNAGYAKRERGRKNGRFLPYKYEISEFKLFLPNCPQQPGDSSLLKEDLLKKEDKSLTKEEKREREEATPTPPPSSIPSLLFGSYQNVKLTQKQYDELVIKFGSEEVDDVVESLSIHLEINPRKAKEYKSIPAVINRWIRSDRKKHKNVSFPGKGISKQAQQNIKLVADMKGKWFEEMSHIRVFGSLYVANSEARTELLFDINPEDFRRAFIKLADLESDGEGKENG